MHLLPLRSHALVGLDIQPEALRLAQLRPYKSVFLLEKIIKIPLPAEMMLDDKICDFSQLHSILIEAISMHNMRGLRAAIHLPASLVRIERLSVPSAATHLKILDEIDSLVRREWPSMTEVLSIDYVEAMHPFTAYKDLIFAATKRDYLTQLLSCVNATGLKVKVVDVDIYALRRLADTANLATLLHTQVQAVAYLDPPRATLIMYDAQEILYHQQWSINASASMAEQLSKQLVIGMANFPQREIKNVLLYGKEAYLRMLPSVLVAAANLTVSCPNPLAAIMFAPYVNKELVNNQMNDYLLAFGLAMRKGLAW